MFRVAVLLLIGAVAWASADECCSAEDRKVIAKQWRDMFHGRDAKFRAGVSQLLLLKVVEKHPEAKALFKNVNIDNPKSGEFEVHCLRIFNALDMSINLLQDEEALDQALDHLADQHHDRTGIKKAYFGTFSEVLYSGLPKILDNYDSMAWKACIGGVFDKIAAKLES